MCTSHQDIASAYNAVKELPTSSPDYNPETVFKSDATRQRGKLQQFFKAKTSSRFPPSRIASAEAAQNVVSRNDMVAAQNSRLFSTSNACKTDKNADSLAPKDSTQGLASVDLDPSQASLGDDTSLLVASQGARLAGNEATYAQHISDKQFSQCSQPGKPDSSSRLDNSSGQGVRTADQDLAGPPAKVPKNAFAALLHGSKKLATASRNDDAPKARSSQARRVFAKGPYVDALRRAAQFPER